MTELPTGWRKIQYASWALWVIGIGLIVGSEPIASLVVNGTAIVGFISSLVVQKIEYRRHHAKRDAAFIDMLRRVA